jgi:hypothetical protein
VSIIAKDQQIGPTELADWILKMAVFFIVGVFDHLIIFYLEMIHNNETHQNMLIIPPAVEFMKVSPSTLKACRSTHLLPATSIPFS